jgi:predicted DNA-binding transcriptional regulator AlpA
VADTPLTSASANQPIRKRHRRQSPLPGLLRRVPAARYCGVGASTWDRLAAAALTPPAIKLGGSVAWSRRELSAWIDHGCPPRAEWSPIWSALLAARRSGRAK